MSLYNAAGIIYTRVNANNTAIAQTNSGVGSPTDIIEAPIVGDGTWATVSGVNITGSGTLFLTQFALNDYLFYINGSGVPVLLGQIDTIGSDTTITLKAASLTASIPGGGPFSLAASYTLITNNESVFMRIPVEPTTGGAKLPDLSVWTVPSTGINIPSISKMERYSNVGSPVSIATPANVSFTLASMNQFTQPSPGILWPSADFPSYIWLRLVPVVGSSTAFNSQTMYKFTTDESLQFIEITSNEPSDVLVAAGYNV
jgi:hypothetical protein